MMMTVKLLLITLLLSIGSTSLFAQDSTVVEASSSYKNEVSLSPFFRSYTGLGGQLGYQRFFGAKNKLGVQLEGLLMRRGAGAKASVYWYLKPQAQSLTIGLSGGYHQNKYYSRKEENVELRLEAGYTFLVKKRFSIYPYGGFAPWATFYNKRTVNGKTTTEGIVAGGNQYKGIYIALGVKIGWRF